MRRVVVTGFGTINPTGNNVNDSWNNLKNGYNGISKVSDKIHEDTGIFNAGQIKDFDPADHLDRKLIRTLDRVVQLSMVASREAYAMADLDGVEDRFRIGTNITSGIGGLQTIEECVHVTMDKGFGKLSPQFIPKSLINLVGGNVAIDLNLKVYKQLDFGKLWGGISYRRSFDGAQYVDGGGLQDQKLQWITPIIGLNYDKFMFSYTYSHIMGDVKFDNGGFHQITLGINVFCKDKAWDCNCPAVN